MGLTFDKAYTINPVCTPTRVTMLTGHYPSKHGCYTIGTSLNEDYPTICDYMNEKGYSTSLIGKAHFQACMSEPSGIETLECTPHVLDLDYFDQWNGPYYGFQHAELLIGHGDETKSSGMHYGAWLRKQGVDSSAFYGRNEYTDFGAWELPQEYATSSWIADRTIKKIEKDLSSDKPFFIWSSFQEPHNPCFVPEPWASMYNPEDMPVYGMAEGELEDKPPFYMEMASKGSYGPELDSVNKNWHCVSNLPQMDAQKKKEIMALYYGMISLMDHHIGRIIDHLEEKDLLKDTLIVFTSDHGDYMGNHGVWWKGLPTYQDMQRIPFIVVHPECKQPGGHSDAIQSTVDIPISFLDYLDIKSPIGFQGVHQLDTWKDTSEKVRDWAMVEFRVSEDDFMQKTLVTDRHKLVVYHGKTYGELYDLKSDPHQLKNLWDSEQQLKYLMMKKLIDAEMEKDGVLRVRTAYA